MPTAYNSNDIAFTIDGDYLLGPAGDILDTDTANLTDPQAALKQIIAHRLMAERSGWDLHPRICGALEQFIGRPINNELTESLQSRAHHVLTHDGLFQRDRLIVRAVNLGAGTEAVVLTIFLRGVSDKPVLMLAFDIQNGQISQVL